MTDAALQQKIAALLAVLAEHQQACQEVVEEIEKLLRGDPGIGARLREVETHWSTCWQARYGTPYVWSHAKDRTHLKRLIKVLGIGELKRRMEAYLRGGDAVDRDAKHPFALFVVTVNRYTTVSREESGAPPVNCTHQPRCATDVRHTARLAKELRGVEAQ